MTPSEPARGRTSVRGGSLPRPELPPWNRTLRYYSSRVLVGAAMRLLFRLRVDGTDELPKGPAVLCFNHLSWVDPFLLYATLPLRPRLFFFGPREEDLRRGPRNRLMYWTATPVPYKPAKTDLLDTARRVQAVFDVGGVLAIAGEGRIHVGERNLLPLQAGAAYFALRGGVPLVPVAISGLSWLDLGRTLRVRVGRRIPVSGRPTSEAVAALTADLRRDLLALLADAPDVPPPGRFGSWLTELFNDWPEGSRAAAAATTAAAGGGTGAAAAGSDVIEADQGEAPGPTGAASGQAARRPA